jgi:hypothetical protein
MMKTYLIEAAAKGLYIQLDLGVARPETATSFKENEHVQATVNDVGVTVRADDGHEETWLLTKKLTPKRLSLVVEKPFHINDLIMNELYYVATTLVLCVMAFEVGLVIGVIV